MNDATPTSECHSKYDERDALVTMCAVGLGRDEARVRQAFDKIEASGPSRARRIMTLMRWTIRFQLNVIPKERHREYASLYGELIKARRAQRPAYYEYPALRQSWMLRIASAFFTQKKVERVFVQLVSDYRLEYTEARREGWHKAQIVRITYWWAFIKACGLDALGPWIDRALKLLGWWL